MVDVSKLSDRKYQCKYCKKRFTREKTVEIHVCDEKRRLLAKDERHVRIGFVAYQRYFDIQHKVAKRKTYEDFIDKKNLFHSAFVRFGKHIININAHDYIEAFTEFVIRTGTPIDKWTEPYVYETFIRENLKTEDVDAAATRAIKVMVQWGLEYSTDWKLFFKEINPILAIEWIKSGKISPWVIFCSTTGCELMNRFTPDQITIVSKFIDTNFWKTKFKNNLVDYDFMKETFEEYGI